MFKYSALFKMLATILSVSSVTFVSRSFATETRAASCGFQDQKENLYVPFLGEHQSSLKKNPVSAYRCKKNCFSYCFDKDREAIPAEILQSIQTCQKNSKSPSCDKVLQAAGYSENEISSPNKRKLALCQTIGASTCLDIALEDSRTAAWLKNDKNNSVALATESRFLLALACDSGATEACKLVDRNAQEYERGLALSCQKDEKCETYISFLHHRGKVKEAQTVIRKACESTNFEQNVCGRITVRSHKMVYHWVQDLYFEGCKLGVAGFCSGLPFVLTRPEELVSKIGAGDYQKLCQKEKNRSFQDCEKATREIVEDLKLATQSNDLARKNCFSRDDKNTAVLCRKLSHGAENDKVAFGFLERACQVDILQCAHLGAFHQRRHENKLAISAYEKACRSLVSGSGDSESKYSCDQLKRLGYEASEAEKEYCTIAGEQKILDQRGSPLEIFQCKDGKRNGPGKFFNESSRDGSLEVTFKDGLINGKAKQGTSSQFTFVSGELVGPASVDNSYRGLKITGAIREGLWEGKLVRVHAGKTSTGDLEKGALKESRAAFNPNPCQERTRAASTSIEKLSWSQQQVLKEITLSCDFEKKPQTEYEKSGLLIHQILKTNGSWTKKLYKKGALFQSISCGEKTESALVKLYQMSLPLLRGEYEILNGKLHGKAKIYKDGFLEGLIEYRMNQIVPETYQRYAEGVKCNL